MIFTQTNRTYRFPTVDEGRVNIMQDGSATVESSSRSGLSGPVRDDWCNLSRTPPYSAYSAELTRFSLRVPAILLSGDKTSQGADCFFHVHLANTVERLTNG